MSIRIVNVEEMEWRHGISPKGKFERYEKHISVAQEWGPDSGAPFDLAKVRLPPGKTNYPLHQHGAQWESFYILSGTAIHEIGGKDEAIQTGDAYMIPPNTPHHIRNTGTEELVYLIIANNVKVDTSHYPKTGKWQIKPEKKLFTMIPANYYDGEE